MTGEKMQTQIMKKTTEGVLKSKNAIKEVGLDIEKYMRKHRLYNPVQVLHITNAQTDNQEAPPCQVSQK